MSILYCPEGALLLQNISEAMRRQCELPAKSRSIEALALEMDTSEAVQAANRHATDHLMACPVCRTGSPMPKAHTTLPPPDKSPPRQFRAKLNSSGKEPKAACQVPKTRRPAPDLDFRVAHSPPSTRYPINSFERIQD
jgi:hypothetical protein